MQLSNRLYDLRKRHGLSQEKLAELLDVSRQSVSRWELGTAVPSSENLAAICALYQISMDVLLEREGVNKEATKTKEPDTGRKKKRGVWLAIFYVCIAAVFLLAGDLHHAPATALLGLLLVSTGFTIYAIVKLLREKKRKIAANKTE